MAKNLGRPQKYTGDVDRTSMRVPHELAKAARIWGIEHDMRSLNDVVILALQRLLGTKGGK